MKEATTIVLTGGGSGGHITPLFSLAQELKSQDSNARIIYIGTKHDDFGDLALNRGAFDKTYKISAGKFRRYHGEGFLSHLFDVKTLALNARDFVRIIIGFFSAAKILRRHRPDVIFSKGGYVGVPVGAAAKALKIPIVTHDSDATAGLANRIVGRWASAHATGQPAHLYKYPRKQTFHVGVPIDPRIKAVTATDNKKFKKRIGVPATARVLLVAGGSLGARQLNQKIAAVGDELLNANPELYIIHITGAGNVLETEKAYQIDPARADRLKVVGFSNDFYVFCGAADLIISRAGATALAEYAAAKKPVILIPATHLAGGHQLQNAKSMKERGAARVLSGNIDASDLKETVNELLADKAVLKRLSDRIGSLATPDAASRLAAIILNVSRHEKNQKDVI